MIQKQPPPRFEIPNAAHQRVTPEAVPAAAGAAMLKVIEVIQMGMVASLKSSHEVANCGDRGKSSQRRMSRERGRRGKERRL
jgi:hypothetical protein